MKTHLLQSEEWQAYERLEGKKSFRLQGERYEALAVLTETPVGNYLMVPYGPAAEDEIGLKNALIALQELAEKHKCFMVRVEPTFCVSRDVAQNLANEAGLRILKTKNIDPEHTWVLDLAPTEEELLSAMESRKVRYWRNYAKKGMSIRKTQDAAEIGVLTELLKGLGEVDHFTPQTEEHLRHQLEAGFATLYIVELDGEGVADADRGGKGMENAKKGGKKVAIAAALVYDYDGVRYYAHAATDFEHRRLLVGTILLIQMILDAKTAGAAIYDFWGVTTSEDPKHPWYGFTQYKKSFGGRQVDYAGTYDLVVAAGKYKLYNGLRKANLAVRKLRK